MCIYAEIKMKVVWFKVDCLIIIDACKKQGKNALKCATNDGYQREIEQYNYCMFSHIQRMGNAPDNKPATLGINQGKVYIQKAPTYDEVFMDLVRKDFCS